MLVKFIVFFTIKKKQISDQVSIASPCSSPSEAPSRSRRLSSWKSSRAKGWHVPCNKQGRQRESMGKFYGKTITIGNFLGFLLEFGDFREAPFFANSSCICGRDHPRKLSPIDSPKGLPSSRLPSRNMFQITLNKPRPYCKILSCTELAVTSISLTFLLAVKSSEVICQTPILAHV